MRALSLRLHRRSFSLPRHQDDTRCCLPMSMRKETNVLAEWKKAKRKGGGEKNFTIPCSGWQSWVCARGSKKQFYSWGWFRKTLYVSCCAKKRRRRGGWLAVRTKKILLEFHLLNRSEEKFWVNERETAGIGVVYFCESFFRLLYGNRKVDGLKWRFFAGSTVPSTTLVQRQQSSSVWGWIGFSLISHPHFSGIWSEQLGCWRSKLACFCALLSLSGSLCRISIRASSNHRVGRVFSLFYPVNCLSRLTQVPHWRTTTSLSERLSRIPSHH